MPKKVEECVQSVLEDNPDMDESTAWAICNEQFSEEKLLRLKEQLGLSGDEFLQALRLLSDSSEACVGPCGSPEASEGE